MLSQNVIYTELLIQASVNLNQYDQSCRNCYHLGYQRKVAPFGFEYVQPQSGKREQHFCCNTTKMDVPVETQQRISNLIPFVQLNLFMEVDNNEFY